LKIHPWNTSVRTALSVAAVAAAVAAAVGTGTDGGFAVVVSRAPTEEGGMKKFAS
jgi:hypothetical protein